MRKKEIAIIDQIYLCRSMTGLTLEDQLDLINLFLKTFKNLKKQDLLDLEYDAPRMFKGIRGILGEALEEIEKEGS